MMNAGKIYKKQLSRRIRNRLVPNLDIWLRTPEGVNALLRDHLPIENPPDPYRQWPREPLPFMDDN
jgi:hypothetical protein